MKTSFRTLRTSVFAFVVAIITLSFIPVDAEARRMGSGGSIGRTAPSYQKSAPAAPSNATAPSRATAPAAAGAAAGTAAAPRNRFLGPIMGLAAGLGLAALFSHLGMGEGLANFMGMLVLAAIAAFVIRKLFTMMRGNNANKPAFAGHAQNSYSNNAMGGNRTFDTDVMRKNTSSESGGFGQFSPASQTTPAFGNDAMATKTAGPVKVLPANFDEAAFLHTAKKFFITMQGLYDQGNLQAMREYCTDDVLADLTTEVKARGNDAYNQTDVVTVEAQLLGFEVDVNEELATVAFNAMVREQIGAPAQEINEVWTLSRPVSGGGWLLCGIHNAS